MLCEILRTVPLRPDSGWSGGYGERDSVQSRLERMSDHRAIIVGSKNEPRALRQRGGKLARMPCTAAFNSPAAASVLIAPNAVPRQRSSFASVA